MAWRPGPRKGFFNFYTETCKYCGEEVPPKKGSISYGRNPETGKKDAKYKYCVCNKCTEARREAKAQTEALLKQIRAGK